LFGELSRKLSGTLQVHLVRVISIEAASKPQRAPCIEAATRELSHDLEALAAEQALQGCVPGF